RIQKSELGIRPVWHQRADRVQAHILVCFLAYVLWKTLEQWQRRAGLGQSPRTILEELRRIQSTDVVLPTEDGRELRLRCVVRPDAAQAALLDRLGLELPERLRIRSPAARTTGGDAGGPRSGARTCGSGRCDARAAGGPPARTSRASRGARCDRCRSPDSGGRH